jgi:ZIP family zinc transporter
MAFAALPALGNFFGVLAAEVLRPPRWIIGALLHGAAGIAVGIIAVELMPRSLETVSAISIAIAFMVGAAASLAFASTVGKLSGSQGKATGAWMVQAAILADLVSDGLITGAGSAASLELGLLLAGSQLLANFPGGFAASSNLRHRGVDRRTRLISGAAVSLPIFIAAAIGFFLLRGTPESVQGIALAGIAGFLLAATLEDLIPEGDAPRPPRWSSTLALAAGFSAIVYLSGLF